MTELHYVTRPTLVALLALIRGSQGYVRAHTLLANSAGRRFRDRTARRIVGGPGLPVTARPHQARCITNTSA